MDKRENFKDIKIGERTFRLGKFDARTGSYMLFKLIGILSPIFKNIKIDKKNNGDGNENAKEDFDLDDINFTELLSSITSLPENEFRYIQDTCLQSVRELLPGNAPQVLDEYGNYGVLDIEFDTMLILNLTVQTLIFNVSGFFGESLLSSLTGALKDISLQNSKM